MLEFSDANAKLRHLPAILAYARNNIKKGTLYSFDLPAGKTCPGARECKSTAVKTPDGWRIKDGPNCRYRCYSASQEVFLANVREKRQRNLNALRKLRTPRQIADAFHQDIPKDCTILRMHTSGDFFKRAYFEGVMLFAIKHRDILIYAYTKAIPYWVEFRRTILALPNYHLTASLGGSYDGLAQQYGFRTCRVVTSVEEAEERGLEIDHDDSYASRIRPDTDFCVLIHGSQPKGSRESKAFYKLRQAGLTGYRRDARGYGSQKKGKTN